MVSFLQYGAKIAKQGGGAQDKKIPGYNKNVYRIAFFASNENERCLVHRPSIVWHPETLIKNAIATLYIYQIFLG